MKIIATCNLKGGVAKTTTTVNLAADLARDHGQRVLVIDADSQANTTAFLAAGAPSGGFAATSLGEETPSVTAASGGASVAGNVARSPRVGISLREGAKVPRTDVVFSLSQLRRVILETLSEESPVREDLPGFVTALTALERRLSGLAGEEV